jgi:hypothetical protein
MLYDTGFGEVLFLLICQDATTHGFFRGDFVKETGELDIYVNLYVLSPVPVNWLEFHWHLTVTPSLSEVTMVLYIPLRWLCHNVI